VGPPSDLPPDPFDDTPEGPGDEPSGGSGPPNPFGGMPLFGDLARMLSAQFGTTGPANTWDTARHFGVNVATGGTREANVDPVVRLRIEELARVAELHVAGATGLPVPTAGPRVVDAVTRSAWVERTLADHRGLFTALGESLADDDTADGVPDVPDPGDPLAFMAPLMKMLGPMMVGLTAGSMVGHLAQRCFGQYDLPIPRPGHEPVMVLAGNVDAFAGDWSLPADDVRLWVCIHQLTHHAVLSVPHVRDRLGVMLGDYVAGFRPAEVDLGDALGGFDPSRLGDPDAMAGLLGDPEMLLGAIRTPEQEALAPRLEALVSVVVGYVDHVMDGIGANLFGDYQQLTEALRRRRVEAGEADRFVERLLGLELSQATYDRGRAFVDGVVERAGADGLARLWEAERQLPTVAEVDAPGLWLARIDLPGD